MQKIIDTHFHEFDVDRFYLDWLQDIPCMNRRIMFSEFEEMCKKGKGYEIIGAIHVELDTPPEQKQDENDYMVNLAKNRSDLIKGAIIYGDMLSENMEEFVSQYLGKKEVLGIRCCLHFDYTPPKTCLSSVFIKNVQRLGELGLGFDACMRSGEMLDLYELASQCPNTIITLNHMGLPSVEAWYDENSQEEIDLWKAGIKKLGTLNNVVCKMSGLSTADLDVIRPLVDFCVDSFGYDNIIFSSNFPVCNWAMDMDDAGPAWTMAMLELFKDVPTEEKDKFFYKNAQRVYNIELD